MQEGSFIVSVDATTGKERWRAKRNEIPTWSSPVAFMAPDGRPTVVVTGTKKSAAYDARTGEELWSLGGFSEIVVPTPQITPHSILLTSGYAPVQPIVALQHGATGELKLPPDKKADAKNTDEKKADDQKTERPESVHTFHLEFEAWRSLYADTNCVSRAIVRG